MTGKKYKIYRKIKKKITKIDGKNSKKIEE